MPNEEIDTEILIHAIEHGTDEEREEALLFDDMWHEIENELTSDEGQVEFAAQIDEIEGIGEDDYVMTLEEWDSLSIDTSQKSSACSIWESLSNQDTYAANAAYWTDDKICDVYRNKQGLIVEAKDDDLKAFTYVDNRKLYVVFRGTLPSSFKNWLLDIDVKTTKFHGYYVYEGFLKAWLALKDKVLERINQSKDYDTISFVGHSLGGAMAVLAAFDFIEEKRDKIDHITTFGQPCVGGLRFTHTLTNHLKYFHINYSRYVNFCDCVPVQPPSLYWAYHTGSKLNFKRCIPLFSQSNPYKVPIKVVSKGEWWAWHHDPEHSCAKLLKTSYPCFKGHSMKRYALNSINQLNRYCCNKKINPC